jgi:putative transposase
MILTYKYRIKDRSARKALRRHAFAVNQVWNYCVAYQRDIESRYRAGAPKREWPTQYDLQNSTRGSSKELGINSKTVHCVCWQFVKNRTALRHSPDFRRSAGPRRSLGWIPFPHQGRQVAGNSVTYLGKLYRFWEGGRPLPANAKGGCFVEDARGRWYVCFQSESAALPAGGGKVGIDLGLKALAVCSDGRKIKSPQIYRRHEKRLAIAQRAGNKRRVKAIHAKIANCRRDFTHKATTKIVRENEMIAVGNVCPSKLRKTWLAKSVLDAGWSMFRAQLRYKASRHGAVYLDIDEKFTTQMCSSCGVIPCSSPKGMGALGIRAWDCSECGASHDRDVNAAKNILILALSAQRRGDESREIAQ